MWEYMGSTNFAWAWMGLGMIGMLLFWILIIVAIVALVKWMWGPRRFAGHGQEKTALDVLNERYARGEVDKEEFDQKKRDLTG
ncbi:MAG: SHOCT domain-containing protein [Casimicrobiaceae bacterium]